MEKYLIPMDQFQEIICEISALSDLFFEEHNSTRRINESLKSTIVAYIDTIEKDVISAMGQAYKMGTWYNTAGKFHGYCADMKYAICHVVNEPKFKWYLGEFKVAALALKSEAVQTAYEAVSYRTQQQSEKKRKDCAKAGKITSDEREELKKATLQCISMGISDSVEILRYIAKEQLLGEDFYYSASNHTVCYHGKEITLKTFRNSLSDWKKIPGI